MDEDLTRRLVDGGDLDGLLRRIDDLCTAGDWDGLWELRDLCHEATEQGPALWPGAANAEYRLALEGDAPHAARAVDEGDSRVALGPLAEVAASTHTWGELAPHLRPGPVRALVAYERALRGEDLRADRSIDTSVFDLPLRVEPWEGTYPLATYEARRAIFPTPALHELFPVRALEDPGRPTADLLATDALAELTRPWTTESNGRGDVVGVEGDHLDAIAALGLASARAGRITPDAALELLAWTAASGGAHGRRRGMAAGRFNAWWVVAAVSGLADDWPVEPDAVGDAAARLEWFAWDTDEPPAGWSFRIAVVDPLHSLAWAAMANDQRLE
ncbi:MAG: hypothetical protein GEV08_12805 [Acidimicrobiia bacterium]|nr:hypothetical protein [Acidimicrobiia bacterium]